MIIIIGFHKRFAVYGFHNKPKIFDATFFSFMAINTSLECMLDMGQIYKKFGIATDMSSTKKNFSNQNLVHSIDLHHTHKLYYFGLHF